MANRNWLGDAQATAQVVTVTITGYHASTSYRITINGKVVSAAGDTDTDTTAEALQAALAASTIPEFQEVTWTVSGSVITGTAATAGKPFTATSSVSGGSGTIGAVTTTVTSSGPNDVSLAANWSGGSLPTNGDAVHVAGTSASLLYGLDALAAVALYSLNVDSTFTGEIGLPEVNPGGYREYRETWLRVGVGHAGGVHVGRGSGPGSGRIKLDVGAVRAAFNIYYTGQPVEQGLPAVQLAGTNAQNTLMVLRGSVGVAPEPAQQSILASVTMGYRDSRSSDADVALGAACALDQAVVTGGTLSFYSDLEYLEVRSGGTATALGSSSIEQVQLQGGTLRFLSDGTIGGPTAGTAQVGTGGILDCSQDPRDRTIEWLVMSAGSSFLDPGKTCTLTNGITLQDCGIEDLAALDIGKNLTLSRS